VKITGSSAGEVSETSRTDFNVIRQDLSGARVSVFG
jgi:hypothetical protein